MKTRQPRLVCFGLGVAGGLIAGAGALATWQTVTMGADVITKGTDTLAGKIALALAVVALLLTLLARKGDTEEPRRWAVACLLVAAIALVVIGVSAQAGWGWVYNDQRPAQAAKMAAAMNAQGIHATTDQVLAQMQAAEAVSTGPGPVILLAGGAMVVLASVAGLLWARAWKRAPVTPPGSDETPTGDQIF